MRINHLGIINKAFGFFSYLCNLFIKDYEKVLSQHIVNYQFAIRGGYVGVHVGRGGSAYQNLVGIHS
jgi:hypothetical protein